MNQYTFNDTDKLKDLADEIKQDLESGFTKISPDPSDYGATQEIMDKLMELCELHERNNLNICLCGGLKTVIEFILNHPDAETRRIACHLMSAVV